MRPRSPTAPWWTRLAAGTAVLAASGILGCATRHGGALSPEALRREVQVRAPDLPEGEIVVPFEVRERDVEVARRAIRAARGSHARATLLAETLGSSQGFGLRYEWARSGTAVETIDSGMGNCIALVSVYVGLARAIGLDARYAVVRLPPERMRDGDLMVRAEHVVASVATERGAFLVQFGLAALDPRERQARVIDDLEALAHVYNNRGYERLHHAQDRGGPPPWEEALRDFALATRIRPEFAAAWNNLGITLARLGRRDEASTAYRTAIVRDPALVSAHRNLGILLRESGDPFAAADAFDEATRLEEGNRRANAPRAAVP